jgi:hypothetical protein
MTNLFAQTWIDQAEAINEHCPSSPRELFADYLQTNQPGPESRDSRKRKKRDLKVSWDSGIHSESSITDFLLHEIEQDIKSELNQRDYNRLAATVESLSNRLDALTSLAESRLRLRLPALSKPQIHGELAQGISEKLECLLRHPDSKVPAIEALKSAELLLRTLPSDILDEYPIAIQWIGVGAIEIRFESALTWIVYPPRLQWPGVKVKTISLPKDLGVAPKTRSFLLAKSVVDYTLKTLNRDAK